MNRIVLRAGWCVIALTWLGVFVAACSGDDESNIELRIVSDLVPFYEVGVATAVLYDGQANASDVSLGSVERALTVGEPLARGLWIATFEGIPHGTYTVWTTLRRENGETLGRKPITFTLSDDASYTVTIEAACASVECPNGGDASFLACVGGECVDPRCTPETPEFCPPGPSPFCDTETTCEATLPCGVARCESGACLQVPSASECDEGEYCSALSGCTAEERPVEAPEDPPGACGNACSLSERPCSYAYVVCTDGASGCEAVSDRPVGAPCPNDGVCNADGECVAGARGDGGVADASVPGDMDVPVDMTTPIDMTVAIDMTTPVDMGMTPCPSGYLGTVETACLDINECMYNVCDARTTCTNAPGSFSCSACPAGFVGTGETGCERENGCDEEPCDPLTVCNTTGVGTFTCSACPVGYLGTGERGCTDVDECTYNVCDGLTTCTNTPGGFTCSACPSGYSGTGQAGCDDIDECAMDACDALTECTNTPGDFECSACPSGYSGTGATGCDDIDECVTGAHTCSSAGACIDRDGTYLCRTVTRVSVAGDGTQANSQSTYASYSNDGTKVVFASNASNLVVGDTNGRADIFVKDLATGVVTLVSSAADGTPANDGSAEPRFSPDGTKVVFQSSATNLHPSDTHFREDIYIKDLVTGAIVFVSKATDGGGGNNDSRRAFFSPDGTKVAFYSFATNLVADDTNATADTFIVDLITGVLSRVPMTESGTVSASGSISYEFSPDGTKIVFTSQGSDFGPLDANGGYTDVYVKDLVTGDVTLVSLAADGTAGNQNTYGGAFSPDGTKVLFRSFASNLVPGDTNGSIDVFLKDLVTGALERVSVAADGAQSNGNSDEFAFSRDGTRIVFMSQATNLVPGDTNANRDIFVKDLLTGEVMLVSVSENGTQNGTDSNYPSFSPDGRGVVYHSFASNLVPGDTNGANDVFVVRLD